MSDGWKELLGGFDEVAPSFDVWEVVQHRRRSSPGAHPSAVGRYFKPALRWSIGVVGVCGLLLALALAAHSRSDPPAPANPKAQARLKTASGVEVTYPASWHARLQRNAIYSGQAILVTSYPVNGDGFVYPKARDSMPSNGVLVLVMDILPPDAYLNGPFAPARPARLDLGSRGSFAGLGNGYRVGFTDKGHAIVAYVAFGGDAPASARSQVLRLLNSITARATPARFLSIDPTAVLSATRVVPIDPAAGWGRHRPGETVFEGLLTTPVTPAVSVGGEWWATVLAVGENVKGGDVLGVGIVRTARDLNEGRPSYRIAHHGWSRAPRKIRAAILAAAQRQGYRIEKLSLHDTPAGTASVVTVTPADSQDAVAYLMKHAPLHVPEVERIGGSAIFIQVVDADGHVVYINGGVPGTITVGWADPRFGCRFTMACPTERP
jgi:hypothetical protein